jgi:hypothetical protein
MQKKKKNKKEKENLIMAYDRINSDEHVYKLDMERLVVDSCKLFLSRTLFLERLTENETNLITFGIANRSLNERVFGYQFKLIFLQKKLLVFPKVSLQLVLSWVNLY